MRSGKTAREAEGRWRVRVEDVRVEIVRVGDVRMEDVKMEIVRVEDVRMEIVRVEDVKMEIVMVEDVRVEDVRVEDVRVKDVRMEDVMVEDVRVKDVRVEVVRMGSHSSVIMQSCTSCIHNVRTRAGSGLASEMPCEVQSLVAAETKTIIVYIQLPTYLVSRLSPLASEKLGGAWERG